MLRGVGKIDTAKLPLDIELVEPSRSGGWLDLVLDSRYQADDLQSIQSTQCSRAVSDLLDELLQGESARSIRCEQKGQHRPLDSISRPRRG